MVVIVHTNSEKMNMNMSMCMCCCQMSGSRMHNRRKGDLAFCRARICAR